VRRHGDGATGDGIGVEFVGLSERRRSEFFRFVTSTVPSLTPAEVGLDVE
jgi:hypothetical protein